MSEEIDIRYDVCKICERETLCVEIDYNENFVVCLDCLRELIYSWCDDDYEKFDFIGTKEYRDNCKKECD